MEPSILSRAVQQFSIWGTQAALRGTQSVNKNSTTTPTHSQKQQSLALKKCLRDRRCSKIESWAAKIFLALYIVTSVSVFSLFVSQFYETTDFSEIFELTLQSYHF
jgi:hypothetical protein